MKNIKAGLLTLTAIATLLSCKDMDLKPYDSLEKSQSLQTVAQARYWNTGIYALLKSRNYGNYTITQDVQVDQLNASADFGNRNGAPHRMDDAFLADDGTLSSIYQNYYSGINNANEAIVGFPKVPTNSVAEADSIKKFMGNAHLVRAFYYHQLALRFCKEYNPATGSQDMGMPLVTVPDLTNKPSRSSLKATYEQILADIAVAKTNLSNITGARGASRFTIDAVLALEARVKLDYHDYDGAYTAATTIIGKNLYTLYNTAAGITSYWTDDAKQEDILQLFADKATGVNVNSIYLGYNAGTNRFTPDFIPTQTVVDLYDNTDFRKAMYFQNKVVFINGVLYNNTLKLVNKFPGNPALFTGATTNYFHKIKMLRIAEQYLIAAEAAFSKAVPDEVNARLYLNALRVARGLTVTNATGTALWEEIKAERQRELAFEGFRLFDLKRWGLGVKRGVPQNIAPLANTIPSSFTQLDRPANYDKLVTWGFPNYERIVNTNINQNTGW